MEIRKVNVMENRELAEKYQVRVVPTIVFLDTDEKVLYRHEGLMKRDEILTKWKEVGYEFPEKGN